jgi:GNAT superfamily N-acetyltransferase
LGGDAILIEYRSGNHLDLDAVIEVYRACSLGARRPVDDRERMRDMLANADITITAWDGPLMVGISRSISDFRYATYLSDLAVRESHQRFGIGKELIRRTQAEAPQARIILLCGARGGGLLPAHRDDPARLVLDARSRGDDP